MSRKLVFRCVISTVLAAMGFAAISGQQAAPAIKRDVVLKQDMTIPGREVIMAEVELPAGTTEGLHTHPSAELFGFVVEGTIEAEIQGEPTKTLKAGDHFYFAPGVVHQNANRSSSPAKTYVVFVAEKGKPLTAPAPAAPGSGPVEATGIREEEGH